MDFTCLGSNEKIRQRRYTVLKLYLKGLTPQEISKKTGLKQKHVYNDVLFLKTHKLNDLPIEIYRDMGMSFYELKIKELESELEKHKQNPSVWLGVQKLIKEYKDTMLKLIGASNEKVECQGDVKVEFVIDSGEKKDNQKQNDETE